MALIHSKIQPLNLFATTDGKQFDDVQSAEAHQSLLDNAEVVEVVAESFCNITTAPGAKVVGLVGRTRVFNKNVAAATVSFLIAKGLLEAESLEVFDAIPASDELQVRLDEFEAAEAVKAEATAKAKAEKDAVNKESKSKVEVEDAEVETDTFK